MYDNQVRNQPVPDMNDPSQRAAAMLRYCTKLHGTGDLQLATAICNRAHETDPTDTAPLLELASIMQDLRRTEAAAEAYRAVLLLDPQRVDALYGLGKIYIETRRYDLATHSLENALLVDRADPRIYNALGVIMDQRGDHATAQAYYKKGLNHSPRNIPLRNNLGLSLVLAGDRDAGLALLREVAAETGADPTASLNLAMASQTPVKAPSPEPRQITTAQPQALRIDPEVADAPAPAEVATTAEVAAPAITAEVAEPAATAEVAEVAAPAESAMPIPAFTAEPTTASMEAALPELGPSAAAPPEEISIDTDATSQAPVSILQPYEHATREPDAASNLPQIVEFQPVPAPEPFAQPAAAEDHSLEGASDMMAAMPPAAAAPAPIVAPMPVAEETPAQTAARSAPVADRAGLEPVEFSFQAAEPMPVAEETPAQAATRNAPVADRAGLDSVEFSSKAVELTPAAGESPALIAAPSAPVADRAELESIGSVQQAATPTRPEISASDTDVPAYNPHDALPSLSLASRPEAPSSGHDGVNEPDSDDWFYTVQLGSYRSPGSARTGWDVVADAAGDLLSGLDAVILRADLGIEQGIVYRVRTEPMADRTAAQQLCSQLQAEGVDCLPIKASRQSTDESMVDRICTTRFGREDCALPAPKPLRSTSLPFNPGPAG